MKKANLWILLGIFGVLVLAYAGIRYFRTPIMNSNIPASLTDLDSAKVTEVVIIPAKQRDQEIHLVRSGTWKIKTGQVEWRLEQGSGQNVLRQLTSVPPERLVSKKQSRWKEFLVSDSTGTRVRAMAGDDLLADLWIGRSGFSQTPGTRFGGTSYTYVRRNGEDEVYSVEGFLDAQFNRVLNDWRDKAFTRLTRDSVMRLKFMYPADSGFQVEKSNGKWHSGAQRADSAAVMAYLGSLSVRNMLEFAEAPSGQPSLVVVLEDKSKEVGRLEAWTGAEKWIVRSSYQPETYFHATADLIKEIWIGRKKLFLTSN